MRIKNQAITLNGTDMTSDIVSDPIWLGHIITYSLQTVFTGTPNGSFKLQASNDEGASDTNISNPTISNWSDISGSSTSVTSSGNLMYNYENAGYRWIRLIWTNSSSGSPSTVTSARFNVKGI